MNEGNKNQNTKSSLTLTADGKLRAVSADELQALQTAKKGQHPLNKLINKLKNSSNKVVRKKSTSKTQPISSSKTTKKPATDEWGMPYSKQSYSFKSNKNTEAETKPSLKQRVKSSFKLPNLSRNKLIIGITVVVIFITSIGAYVYSNSHKSAKVSTAVLGTKITKPAFDTVKPASGTDNKVMGYDPERKVASFTDKISGVFVTVSEQPIPDSFKSNPDTELEKLAKQIYANELIKAGEIKAYSGLSIKGPQTVVFVKNKLLIFMYANQKIDSTEWANYITNLR